MNSNDYNPQTALLLAQVAKLAYTQYNMGLHNPQYDGTIQPPDGFRQTTSFTAPELSFTNQKAPQSLKSSLAAIPPEQVSLINPEQLNKLVTGINRVYFGFALEATDGSGNCIIALRGTEDPYEWVMDACFIQVPMPLIWFNHGFELAKAHFGFLFLYAFLIEQIKKAAQKFINCKVCYVTGHSLGAALAVLGALTLGLYVFPLEGRSGKVQLYNYAGPRVGNPMFAEAYNYFIPCSYRVTNLADLVPVIPLESIFGNTYRHIGAEDQEWSFLNQTGDVGGNHSIDNYLSALNKPGVVTNIKRIYPNSGV